MAEPNKRAGVAKAGATLATIGFILVIIALAVTLFGGVLEWLPVIGSFVGVISFFSPLLNFVGFILAGVGLILSIIGVGNPKAKKGIVLGIIAIIIVIVTVIVKVISVIIAILIIIALGVGLYYLITNWENIVNSIASDYGLVYTSLKAIL